MCLFDKFKDKKVFLFVDNDLDGVSARIIAEYYIKPICNKFYVQNSADRTMKEFEQHLADRSEIIVFVDIVPTIELYNILKKDNKQIIIFDHHKTSYELLKDIIKENYYYTIEKCGAKILFDEITKGKRIKKYINQFVERINCYDLWQDKSSLWYESKSLHNLYFGTINWNLKQDDTERCRKFVNEQLRKFDQCKYFYFEKWEKDIILEQEKKEKYNLQQARTNLKIRKDGNSINYGYFECNSKISYVANILLREREDLQYIVGHSIYEENEQIYKNRMKISLRSLGYNVYKIAELYKGGGHNSAAGMFLDYENFKKFRNNETNLV